MKVLNFFRIALCTVAVAFASSCVDPNQEPTINFPEATNYDLAIDQELELSFKAEATWKLTTDKDWLKFVDPVLGNTETFDGPAGDQTIKITTENVTSIFDEETAVISIEMGGQSKPLFNITKTAVARWAKMFFGVYNETPIEVTVDTPLIVEYDDMSSELMQAINFQANFAWKIAEWPEWIDMRDYAGYSSEANNEVNQCNYIFFYVKNSAFASPKTGNITITDMNGNNPFSFPVAYAGLPENVVLITNSEGKTPGIWRDYITFTADKYVVEHNEMLGETAITESTEMQLSVMTRDGEYQVYCADYSVGSMGNDIYDFADWITIDTATPGTLKISVTENTGAERTAYVWVLPKSKLPEGEIDLDWFYDNFDTDYMFAVVQEGAASASPSGFYAVWTAWEYTDVSSQIIPFAEYDFDGLSLDEISWGLPQNNTYVYELPEGYSGPLGIAPVGFPTEWYPLSSVPDSDSIVTLYSAVEPFGTNVFSKDQDKFTNTTIYINWMYPYCGLGYTVSANGPGTLLIKFYQDIADKEDGKPSAALILIQK